MFILLAFFAKLVLLKVVHPLQIYQQTKFHGPVLTGASFASNPVVSTSTILEWLKLNDKELWCLGHLQWHDLPTKFHKIC
jgi:hypothetical protein